MVPHSTNPVLQKEKWLASNHIEFHGVPPSQSISPGVGTGKGPGQNAQAAKALPAVWCAAWPRKENAGVPWRPLNIESEACSATCTEEGCRVQRRGSSSKGKHLIWGVPSKSQSCRYPPTGSLRFPFEEKAAELQPRVTP